MDYSELLKICCQDNKLEDKNIELIANKSLNISFEEFKLVIENYIIHDYPNLESKINLLLNSRIYIEEKSNCEINHEFKTLNVNTSFFEELIQVFDLFDEKELLTIDHINLDKNCSVKIINGLIKTPNLTGYTAENKIDTFELPIGKYLTGIELSNSNVKNLPVDFYKKINNYKIKPGEWGSSMSIFLDGNPLIDNSVLWENNLNVYDILNKYQKISNKENEEHYVCFRIKTNNTYPENKTNLVFDQITDKGWGIIFHPKSPKSQISINDNDLHNAIVDKNNINKWNWKLYLFWFVIIYLCYEWFKN
jgi:hypothetical protein